jgi:hypothetical protein
MFGVETVMKLLRSVVAFLLSAGSAYSASFAADLLFGKLFGLFPNTVWVPIGTWSVLAVFLMYGSHRLSRSKWLIAVPVLLFGALAFFGAVVGSHPHNYLVAGVLFLIAFLCWRLPSPHPGPTCSDSPSKGENMTALGNLIKVTGWIVFTVTGLWGFFLCLAIISKAAGFWGVVAALFLGPVTFVAAPFYAGFAWDNWFPLLLNYGGGIVSAVLIGIGNTLSGD